MTSRWAYTQTVAETHCPRCQAIPGAYCRTPGGRKAWPPHEERQREYHTTIGDEEFRRRHSARALTMTEVMERMRGK